MRSLLPSFTRQPAWPAWSWHRDDGLDEVREELERSLRSIEQLWSSNGEALPLAPRTDMRENDGELEIKMDLAGFMEKDLDVSIADGRLTVKAERNDERKSKEGTFHVCERRIGSIYRSLALPCEVDEKKVHADMKDGVLTVTLPKAPGSRTRVTKVAVKHAT